MRHQRLFFAVTSLAFTACAGSQASKSHSAAAATSRGGNSPAVQTTHEEDGTPGCWIRQGSVALAGDGGRAFYGVGAASGIRNSALLRTTADNRGPRRARQSL
ncbi:MAG: hypothetical protein R3C68_07500 [Myxococcota bacterium]